MQYQRVATQAPLSAVTDQTSEPRADSAGFDALFDESPEVEALEVRRGDGPYVTPERHETLGGVTLYVADFKSSTQGFGYTAKDYEGTVLESAIT